MSRPIDVEDLEHVLDHTRPLWDCIRGKRIFLTGGTGFFGAWLLESFAFANARLELGAQMVVLTRDPLAFRAKATHLASNPALELLKGDIRDFAFPRGEFFHVIHAATTSSAPVAPAEMLHTIFEGTRHTLEFAVACHAEKFLFTSSGAVYGPQPSNLPHVSEHYIGSSDIGDPRTAYGEGKRVAELLCNSYAQQYGIDVRIARCFAFVGPHLRLDAHFAIGNFIRDAILGRAIEVRGDGTPLRSYLYSADLAIWLWTLLLSDHPCSPCNVGSDQAISIGDLALTIGNLFGVEVRICGSPEPTAAPSRYVPAIQRGREQFNLQPWIGLEDAIARTVRWHLSADRDN